MRHTRFKSVLLLDFYQCRDQLEFHSSNARVLLFVKFVQIFFRVLNVIGKFFRRVAKGSLKHVSGSLDAVLDLEREVP